MLSLTSLSVCHYNTKCIYIFVSYCEEDEIPFSLQALQSGQLVLGCARPSCFGLGVKIDKDARFYRIHKKNDGFMRHDLKKYDEVKFMARESQLAALQSGQLVLGCARPSCFGLGVKIDKDARFYRLLLKCCTFDNLKNSWDRGIADVNPGQVGDEIMQDERQYAFDYIANIKKYFKKSG
uniref:Uncharacterized protein n=1 Tax=Wuchereria bancrofti TaxID=6293 RepID=A0AAF5Q608_WUCBA